MAIYKTYQYEPLAATDEIRILALDPATYKSTPLTCSIIHCRRSAQNTEYSAVSYAWGNPDYMQNLMVTSSGGTSCLKISTTVDNVLRGAPITQRFAFVAFWLQSGFKADYFLNTAAPLGTARDSCSLLENFWYFHKAECGEKKDRVAALLGLSENDGDVAEFALRSENNDTKIQVLLHLFEFGPVDRLNDADCPSWVPDWPNTKTRNLPYHSRAANVDFGEEHLSSLEELSDKALLTMRDDILQIHSSPSIGGDQSWRVEYVKPPSNMACYEPSHVISMLNHLFPTFATESPIAVLHLSSLVYLTSYHRPMKGWIESPEFDRYTEEVYAKLLEGRLDIRMGRYLHYKRSISALRRICALLHDFCLFDLRPRRKQASGADRALGLGPKDTLFNDVMVPLWRRRVQLLRSWIRRGSTSGGWAY
ncbi:HET domain-containing protein [Apiospora saccharicola]|uniref:HET domain-containing protein n=1 Tax=Apiospora saccharicola TaxID=335842 RepID=A0ABR1TMV8_9PEZI